MAEQNEGLLSKAFKAMEVGLDSYLSKAKSSVKDEPAWDRRALLEVDAPTEQQYGWKERRGLVGPEVLKNMARKDSVIVAIRKTRLAQISLFTKPQSDKYSPGWIISPRIPVDVSREDKLRMTDPTVLNDDEAYQAVKYELEQKRAKELEKQDKEIEKIKAFIQHCGGDEQESSAIGKRLGFHKFVHLITDDRMIYNYAAIERIPTKDRQSIASFHPVSSGTIRLVSKQSSDRYKKMLKEQLAKEGKDYKDDGKDFIYVQVVRGRIVAAWTEDQLVFEPASPTVDPEDNGYAQGELEQLVQIVTAHLYAESHNRNFFTQGIGTKGILHIKGDNINRAQLEAFKRQWFNQVVNTRNAFRPPIIGIADDVKWVELAQSNKDMEFDNWMHYLIRICCAVYQIDPAEINFDISKVSTGTLNESSNEQRIKASRDKGLKPLLDYIENIVNDEILRKWNPKLADKYEFKFVGLDAESRKEEIERLEKETKVWKTLNEARVEQGKEPIEDGDLVLNATYTQFKMQKDMAQQENDPNNPNNQDPNAEQNAVDQANEDQDKTKTDFETDNNKYMEEINQALDSVSADHGAEKDKQEKIDMQAQKEKDKAKAQKDVKKSDATKIEYYGNDEDGSNE